MMYSTRLSQSIVYESFEEITNKMMWILISMCFESIKRKCDKECAFRWLKADFSTILSTLNCRKLPTHTNCIFRFALHTAQFNITHKIVDLIHRWNANLVWFFFFAFCISKGILRLLWIIRKKILIKCFPNFCHWTACWIDCCLQTCIRRTAWYYH